MLSRLADSFYWMSRYIERAENVSRFIDVNVNLMLDSSLSEDKEQWFPLVTTSGDEEDFKARYEEATRENVIYFLFADKKNPNSIFSCLQKPAKTPAPCGNPSPVKCGSSSTAFI